MAEFGEDGCSLPPVHVGGTAAVPSDEAAGKTHCEGSVLNGDCGINENMVGSGSHGAPGCQAGVDTAGVDAKSEIPRRSSIIKVKFIHSYREAGWWWWWKFISVFVCW